MPLLEQERLGLNSAEKHLLGKNRQILLRQMEEDRILLQLLREELPLRFSLLPLDSLEVLRREIDIEVLKIAVPLLAAAPSVGAVARAFVVFPSLRFPTDEAVIGPRLHITLRLGLLILEIAIPCRNLPLRFWLHTE